MQKKILIVDDDEKFRSLVEEILQENGFSTVSAKNGYEALETSQDKLEATVPVIRPQQNLRPNITAPYKQASHLCWWKLVTWQVQSVLSTPQ